MQVRVLGCSGGIGGKRRTTSLLVDDDILIDAGTGVADLDIEQMMRIQHIFLTHSHLDHITSLPLLADTVCGLSATHLTVHATRETWRILKNHIFNWKIWPDFTVIPTPEQPLIRYSELRIGEPVVLGQRKVTALPANHTVPAVGYQLDSGDASLVFTGDTTVCEELWPVVSRLHNLKYLIIETSFRNSESELARQSMHLCPSMLMQELAKLERAVRVYITHLKPGEEEAIMAEIAYGEKHFPIRALRQKQVLTL